MKQTLRAQIWQLKQAAPAVLLYEGYDGIGRYGLSFDPANYELVYEISHSGDCGDDVLEDLFVRFNIDKPHDFRGHSLSVSDVIVLDDRAFYVDSIGFREVNWHKEEQAA